MQQSVTFAAGIVLCVLFSGAPVASAQDASNVLVVVNQASSDSEAIGQHYAKVRRIPPEQILRLKTDTAEQTTRDRYIDEIARPVAAWLARNAAQDRILYIVLTKGIPLQIAGTDGPKGTVSSVDSELTLLYRVLAGGGAAAAGPLPNPYFHDTRSVTEAQRFSHRDQDIYLVSRLDAFTVADVIALIDRGAAPSRDGVFVLDGKGGLVDPGGDAWLKAAAAALGRAGLDQRVTLDATSTVIEGQSPALGYFSWGSNDPAITARKPGVRFAPGAVGAMFVSTDARTFAPPPAQWTVGKWEDKSSFFAGSPQSLTGDLISAGITGVAGHVAEPYLAGSVRPQVLFPAYVAGFNLIEAFYLAMPYVSWQTVVIGDPLCAPFPASVQVVDANPPLDPETELPKLFSDRRLAALSRVGIGAQAAKLSLRAEARMAKGDREGSQQALEMATALDPRLIVDQFTLANRYLEGGDFDKSIDRYRTILATAPSEMRSANNLAYTLAVHKRLPTEALPLAQKAYKLSRSTPPQSLADVLGNASIADTLGWIHFLLGNMSDAEKYLTEAVQGAPENAEIRLHLSQFHLSAGRVDVAVKELNAALKLDPTFEKRDDVIKLKPKIAEAEKSTAKAEKSKGDQ